MTRIGEGPAVAIRNVTKRFANTVALDDVSFEIASGSMHALVGRNGAGKSTLVGTLTGLLHPDSGSVEGEKAACVYQHSMIVPHVSVAENIFLHRQPTVGPGAVDWRAMRRNARTLLDEWNLAIGENAMGSALSVEERQLVEVVRALSSGARFVILDEPTARLEARGIERLFSHLRALNAGGVTIMFISHHLQEVYDLCDTVTVMRDGKHVTTQPVAGLPKNALVAAMTGDAERLAAPRPSVEESAAEYKSVILSPDAQRASGVEGRPSERSETRLLTMTNVSSDTLKDVSLSVAAGEIVGVAGIGGSGKVELAEIISGLRKQTSGTVRVDDATLRGGVRNAINAGVGYIPRDRHKEGLVLGLSIAENATMTIDDKLGASGFIDPNKRMREGESAISRLDIRAASAQQSVGELSGGNQQKVVFARALARDPRVLVAVDPTAGVDVRSKEALHAELERIRSGGTAVVIVSDDLDDLRLCDRAIVLFDGRITGEVERGWRDGDLIAKMEGLTVA